MPKARVFLAAVFWAVSLAQVAPLHAADEDVDAAIEAARRAYRETGEYETAISLLDEVIASLPKDHPKLRDAYVARIQASVGYANSKTDDPLIAKSLRDDAFNRVMECLQTAELRSTRPREDEDFQAELSEMFDRARSILFGSLSIRDMEPRTAMVILDGDTLLGGTDGSLVAADVPIGPKGIVIEAEGYRTVRETLEFEPGRILSPAYRLEKVKGSMWWGTRIGAGALLGLAIYALIPDDEPSPEPLPGPPDPPQ